MAINKVLNTRLKLKYDTYNNWMAQGGTDYSATNPPAEYDGFIPLRGEVCVVSIPKDASTPEDNILLKVGDGTLNFATLPWISAKAADVEGWAKRKNVTISTRTVSDTFSVTDSDGETVEKSVNITHYDLCFNNGYETSTGTYTDPVKFSLDGLYNLTNLNPKIKENLGTGDIIDAINYVYNCVQAGGTGSVVSVVDSDEDTEIDGKTYSSIYREVFQGGNKVGQIDIHVNRDNLDYNKDKNILYHSTPSTGSKVTPTADDTSTNNFITSISTDKNGHVTGATYSTASIEDKNTTYILTTKEDSEKGVATLHSSDATENLDNYNDVIFLGGGGTSVYSNGAGNITIDSEVIRVDDVENNPVVVESKSTQDADIQYTVKHVNFENNNIVEDNIYTELDHKAKIDVISDIEYDIYGHVSGATLKKYILPTLDVGEADTPEDVIDEGKFVWKIEEKKSDDGETIDGEIVYHTEPFVGDISKNSTAKRAPQTAAVVAYISGIRQELEGTIGAATNGAVVIKGTIAAREGEGTEATIYGTLPAASKAILGHAYKVVSLDVQRPPYNDMSGVAKVGDMFICYEVTAPTNEAGDNGVYDWLYVPSGDEIDTWRAINVNGVVEQNNSIISGDLKLDDGDKIKLIVDSSKAISFNHETITESDVNKTGNQEITNNSKFTADKVTVDKYGHVTEHTSTEYTLKESPAFAKVKTSDNGANLATALASTSTTKLAKAVDATLEIDTGNKWIDIAVSDSTDEDKHPVIDIGHSLSGVTARSAGSTSSKTFKVPEITVDAAGHITSLSEGAELTIPEIPEIPEPPTHLPNPNPLVFKGAIKYGEPEDNYELDVPYDGSKQLNVKSFDSSIYLHRDESNLTNVTTISLESAKYFLDPVKDITRTIGDDIISGASFGLERNMTGESFTALVQVIGEKSNSKDIVTINPISGNSDAYSTDKGAIQVTIANKGIITEKIDDHAVGAKQIKAEQGYTGSDAEVWVFDCGSSSVLVDNTGLQ